MVILLIIIIRNKCSAKRGYYLFFSLPPFPIFPLLLSFLTDKDIHHGHDSLSHRSHQQQQQQHPSSSSPYVGTHDLQQHTSTSVYPHHHPTAVSQTYLRRGSVDYGGAGGSDGSSADSSSVHLPLDNLSMQPSHSLGYNVSLNFSN